MSSNILKLYAVFHKPSLVPQCDFIEPLQVGRACTDTDLGFTSDNTGDNISVKNATYCELTALYWIWKHLDKIDSTYIGLCHYRRYFTLPRLKKSLLTKKIDKNPVYGDELSEAALSRA